MERDDEVGIVGADIQCTDVRCQRYQHPQCQPRLHSLGTFGNCVEDGTHVVNLVRGGGLHDHHDEDSSQSGPESGEEPDAGEGASGPGVLFAEDEDSVDMYGSEGSGEFDAGDPQDMQDLEDFSMLTGPRTSTRMKLTGA